MMTQAWKYLAAGALAASIVGCGSDGKDEGGTQGGVADIHGEVRGSTGGAQLTNPHVGLVWGQFDETTGAPIMATESAPLAGDLDTFNLSIFSQPPAGFVEAYDTDGDGTDDLRLAFGFVVGYEDVDGNGTFAVNETGIDAPDRLFGFSWLEYLMYLETAPGSDTAAMMFTNPEAATPGLHVVRIDPCGGTLEIVPTGTALDVWTFPPSSNIPEELPAEMEQEFDCGWEDPAAGPCALDETSADCTACLAAHDGSSCVDPTCTTEFDALLTCGDANGCDGQDRTCYEAHCQAEIDAAMACATNCEDAQVCYYGPVEG